MNDQKTFDTSLQKVYLNDKYSELCNDLGSKIVFLLNDEMQNWASDHLKTNTSFAPQSTSSPHHSKDKASKVRLLPQREFIACPSLLTELLSVNHIKSIYNVFVAILLILLLHKASDELINNGRFNLGLSLITWAFGQFEVVLAIWFCMKLSTIIIVYCCFHHWAYNRHKAKGVYDVAGTILLIVYLTLFLHLPLASLIKYNLPPASSVIVTCEQVRLFMKTYAFVRSNVNRATNYKKNDRDKDARSQCPPFSHFLYFLFVPTLVYRDEYPRNSSCNWRKVLMDFLQVIGCITYAHFLFTNFCIPAIEKFGLEEFSMSRLVVTVFSCCFPGACLLLCGFFAVLHSWMNAFAEMFRFADRAFYKDWWNSTSYARFYRTWNCVVHDWLYEYIFKEFSDLQNQFKVRYRFVGYLNFIPMLMVFLISSLVHEYILSASFRFCYPVLLVMFGGFGALFMFLNTRANYYNIFMWMSLILGTGMLTCLYMIEWYARINCPPMRDDFLDLFIPRSWFCYSRIS